MQSVLIFYIGCKRSHFDGLKQKRRGRRLIDNNRPTAPPGGAPAAPGTAAPRGPKVPRSPSSLNYRHVRGIQIIGIEIGGVKVPSIKIPAPPRLRNTAPTFCFPPPRKYSAHSVGVDVEARRSSEGGGVCVCGFIWMFLCVPSGGSAMAENLSQSELDYPFKLLEYFNGFRVSKVTASNGSDGRFPALSLSCRSLFYVNLRRRLPGGSILDLKGRFCLE